MAIYAGASQNTIGGTASGSGNTISANSQNGVYISDSGTTGNLVEGDFIGTDPTGAHALPNSIGIIIQNGATNNTIGGNSSSARDLISGNDGDGVHINGGGTSGNLVEGDYIGVNASGLAGLGNRNNGVFILGGASNNTIGGLGSGSGDVISGNGQNGVDISDSNTSGNVVEGDDIGVSANGSAAVPNDEDGVFMQNQASYNTIGGTTTAARNVISGNFDDGILLTDFSTSSNAIQGNYIGSDASGQHALPNSNDGIQIDNQANVNVIGASNAGNLIAYNGSNGVEIDGTIGNVIQYDTINDNGANGVFLDVASQTVVVYCTIDYNSEWGILNQNSTNSRISNDTFVNNGSGNIGT